MSSGKRWTHDELMIAMNLYCKLPFGQLHRNNALIVSVAKQLGRTSSSLAMKLVNFASLDPYHQARGVRGLSGASSADRAIWAEFHDDWEKLGVASEERFQQLVSEEFVEASLPPSRTHRRSPPVANYQRSVPIGPTEIMQSTKVRLGQRFFRHSILASYNSRCCVTGNPVPELLVASHILPWGSHPEQRLNPCNGLCLAQTQDAAFDRGLITFDEDFRLVLSPYLRDFLPNETLTRNFSAYEGVKIVMPQKFLPDEEFMRQHRAEVFRGE